MRSLSYEKVSRERQIVSAVMALGLLTISINIQSSAAGLSSESYTTVNVASQRWTVSSISITPQSYSSLRSQWQPVGGYTSYILQWSKDPNFAGASTIEIAGNEYTAQNLDASTNYYFRIQAVGAPASWSSTTLFKTPDPVLSINSPNDVLAFDARGELWNYGPAGNTTAIKRSIAPAGTSVPDNFYIADWNGDNVLDLIVKNSTGNLDLWEGLSSGGFKISTIGTGHWEDYDMAVGKWKNSDPLVSAIGIFRVTGELFHYPNPDGEGHDPRNLVSSGWLNMKVLLVDFDKDGRSDIVAKTSNGELRLYRTNGNGELIQENRELLGVGWSGMDSMSIVYNMDGAGTQGLITREVASGILYYYPIEGSAFGSRRQIHSEFTNLKLSGN